MKAYEVTYCGRGYQLFNKQCLWVMWFQKRQVEHPNELEWFRGFICNEDEVIDRLKGWGIAGQELAELFREGQS